MSDRVGKPVIVTDIFKNTDFKALQDREVVASLMAYCPNDEQYARLTSWVQGQGLLGLVLIKVQNWGKLDSPHLKFFNAVESQELVERLQPQGGMAILMVADPDSNKCIEALSMVDLYIMKGGLIL